MSSCPQKICFSSQLSPEISAIFSVSDMGAMFPFTTFASLLVKIFTLILSTENIAIEASIIAIKIKDITRLYMPK